MKYYVIENSDGDTFVTEYTKDELQQRMDEEDMICLDNVNVGETNYWGESCLIVKGEIVIPKIKLSL